MGLRARTVLRPPSNSVAEQLGHWAYQPVKRTEPKAVKESDLGS